MSMRDLAAKYQPVVIAAAIAVIALAIVMIVRQLGGGGAQVAVTIGGQAWFYDLSSHTLFVDDNARHAPFTAPSGGTAVRALVFACGDCAVEADRRIGHLRRYTDEALRKLQDAGSGVTPALLDEIGQTGFEVALPPDAGGQPRWVSITQPASMPIMERHLSACGQTPMTECLP